MNAEYNTFKNRNKTECVREKFEVHFIKVSR